jgi:hypothetical protein
MVVQIPGHLLDPVRAVADAFRVCRMLNRGTGIRGACTWRGVSRPSCTGGLSIPCDTVFARSALILRSARDTASSVVGQPWPTACAFPHSSLSSWRLNPDAYMTSETTLEDLARLPRALATECGHGVSPHPMERGQPRWGRLPDPSVAPDVVMVHLNRLTLAFQHDSASLTHA